MRSPWQAKSQMPSKSNLVGPEFNWNMIGIWGRGYLQEQKWLRKGGSLEHTAQPAGSSMGWECPFQLTQLLYHLPGSVAGFCLFQEAGLVSEVFFAAWFVQQWISSLYCLLLGGRGLVNLVCVTDFLKLFRFVYHLSQWASPQDRLLSRKGNRYVTEGNKHLELKPAAPSLPFK